MPFNGIFDPDQLTMLRSAVDQYCSECNVADQLEREHVAFVATALFDLGATNFEELTKQLSRVLGCHSSGCL